MSRINDALKKARQAHAATPSTAAGPALRPLRTPAAPPRRTSFTRPVILLAAGLLVGAACWIGFAWGGKGLPVRANSMIYPPPAPTLEVSAPPATTVVSNTEPAPTADVTPAPSETPAPAAPVSLAATEPATAPDAPPVPTPSVSDASPAADAPIPEPTLVLQGLLYRPGSPMAIINGQSVTIGSHVGDARVVAVDQHSATVVTATGRTNVLEMSGY